MFGSLFNKIERAYGHILRAKWMHHWFLSSVPVTVTTFLLGKLNKHTSLIYCPPWLSSLGPWVELRAGYALQPRLELSLVLDFEDDWRVLSSSAG